MAKFIGKAGEFQKEKAISRRLNAIAAFFIVFALLVFALGWTSGHLYGSHNLWTYLGAFVAFLLTIPAVKIVERMFDKQIRLASNEEDGAAGEREIVPFLQKLPEAYTVISDLDFADSYGNIDHLLIGPTGVFAIDVKNWKGTVTADGKGELLCNGRPTDKPHVRNFTARAMELKTRLTALTRLDPFVQCVFVFPHTHIQAKWGNTGYVHCIHAEQIHEYITKYRPNNPPSTADISRLISAARALKDTVAPAPIQREASVAANRKTNDPRITNNDDRDKKEII